MSQQPNAQAWIFVLLVNRTDYSHTFDMNTVNQGKPVTPGGELSIVALSLIVSTNIA